MSGTRPKVLVTRDDFPQEAMDILKAKCDVEVLNTTTLNWKEALFKHAIGKDALLIYSYEKINKELLDTAGPNLKVVSTVSAGYEHIDIEECKKRNIHVGITSDVLADAVADLAIALLLSVTRRIPESMREIERGNWRADNWTLRYLNGVDIKGKTAGVVGLGRIGSAIAERLKVFKPKEVLYCNRRQRSDDEVLGVHFVSFNELLKRSDFVIISCPLNDSTKNLFNKETFSKMKKSSILINISRGGVVDHDALLEAFKNKTIKGAGLDVTMPEPLPLGHPLYSFENCVITPHIGSASWETRTGMNVVAAENVIAALEEKKISSLLF